MKINISIGIILFTLSASSPAAPDNTQLAVWANEAIIATYTFSHKNFLDRQKEIAKYFTAAGWINYSTALNRSKLPEAVAANFYNVSAVATLPPEIKPLGNNQWQATMPVLVVYKNPQYQQKQNLTITITYQEAPSGRGVRGLAITSLQAEIAKPKWRCQPINGSTEEITASE